VDDKHQKIILDDMRLCLRQVALELEAAAAAAKTAADAIPHRQASWGPVQQLYTRLDEANHLASTFKTKIDDAIADGALTTRS
jgi:hypothetical protein